MNNNEARKLAAIMFTDMVGYSAIAQELNNDNKQIIYLTLKMSKEAIRNLEDTFRENRDAERSRYLFLANHPIFDFLQANPRFIKVLTNYKKLYEDLVNKYGDSPLIDEIK